MKLYLVISPYGNRIQIASSVEEAGELCGRGGVFEFEGRDVTQEVRDASSAKWIEEHGFKGEKRYERS